MNIHKFYQNKAMASLNASLLALIPAITLVILIPLFINSTSIWIFVLPFMLYSFVSYQYYILNRDRKNDLRTTSFSQEHLSLDQRDMFAINFLPSPSLRLVFFTREGDLTGELLDANNNKIRWFLPYFIDSFLARSYQFIGTEDQILATYKQLNKKQWEVFNADRERIGNVVQKEKDRYEVVDRISKVIVKMESSRAYTDFRCVDDAGTELLRVRKGWLPTHWEECFKDPNTPILSFAPHLTLEQRIIFLTLVIQSLKYQDH